MRGRLTDPIAVLWIAWLIYWWVCSLRAKPAVRRQSPWSRIAHGLPLAIAVILLVMRRPDNWLGGSVLPWHDRGRYDVGLAMVAAGLAFSVWARVTLGRNWSATVTVKERHELIVEGPYRFVRHPIYTGMLLAFLGTALAQNEWRSVLACVLVWLSLWHKWRLEERFMRETFGDAYMQYRAATPAVIPYRLPR